MLVKYSDGKSGIIDYLKDGRKRDRDFSREMSDERVTILGDIDTTEQILDATEMGYKHITLSFKEDDVSIEEMQQAIDEYMKFVMHGYQKDEYNAYAEVHYPKLKSYTTKQGDLIVRKPHIHLVIPKVNLLTQKQLRPLGFVKQNIDFNQAFQEKFNIENGYASPSENRSKQLINDVKGRYEFFEIFEKDVELKNDLIDIILKDDIKNFSEFKEKLAEFGIVRETKATLKRDGYLSVKETHHSKFVRLKEFMFTRDFIEGYSKDEKINFLIKKDEEKFIQKSEKRDAAELKKYERDLDYWYKIRAREIKYLNESTKFYKEEYKNYSKEQRIAYLDKVEKEFYKANSMEFEKQELKDFQLQIQDKEYSHDSVISTKKKEYVNNIFYEKHHNIIDVSSAFRIVKAEQGLLDGKYQFDDASNKVIIGTELVEITEFLKEHMRFKESDVLALEQKINQLEKGKMMKNVNINIKTNSSDNTKVDYYQMGIEDAANRFTGVIHDKTSEVDTARAYVILDKVVSMQEFQTQQKEMYDAIEQKTHDLFDRTTTISYSDKHRTEVQNTKVSLSKMGEVYANSQYNMKEIQPIEMGVTKFDKKLDKNFFTIAKEFITMKNFRDNMKVAYDNFKQNMKAIFTSKPELAASNISMAIQLKELKQELEAIKTAAAAQKIIEEQRKQKEENQTEEKQKEKPELGIKELTSKIANLYDFAKDTQDEIALAKDLADLKESLPEHQFEMFDSISELQANVSNEKIEPTLAKELVENTLEPQEKLDHVNAANFMVANGLNINKGMQSVKKMVDTIEAAIQTCRSQSLDFGQVMAAITRDLVDHQKTQSKAKSHEAER